MSRLRAPDLLALLAAAALLGCGPSAPPDDPTDVAHGRDDEAIDREPTERADLRALGPTARFSDLAGAARQLDDLRDQESDRGCLLARGWRLEADLAVAVRPLPTPPDDLDARLAEDPGPVTVLSRWGAYGSGDPSHLSSSSVTATLPPRREPAVLWVVTDQGVYVRSTEGAATANGPRGAEEAASALGDPAAVGALFVTAEAGVSLERLSEVLSRIPSALAGRVGLAVTLAEGTRLPDAPAPEPSRDDAHCPDGLPSLPEDAPVGQLRPQAIVGSLGPLRQAAASCVSAAEGAGAGGGRVSLAIRIGPDGLVQEACAVEDSTDDATLRACLARAARTTAFPAPDPSGSVDVQLPLALVPPESQRQRPLCAD